MPEGEGKRKKNEGKKKGRDNGVQAKTPK